MALRHSEGGSQLREIAEADVQQLMQRLMLLLNATKMKMRMMKVLTYHEIKSNVCLCMDILPRNRL